MTHPLAVIFGCAGTELGKDEAGFFRDSDPLGFILFARNVDNPEQVHRLCNDLRTAVDREDAPVLIDQEGGRVQRLQPPHWRNVPEPGVFAGLYRRDPDAAVEAARLNARLIAHDLHGLGIDVDCLPVLDVPQADSHPFLKGRAAGTTPEQASILGQAACDGLLEGGVLPVIKHIPGHGRATADSHFGLPRVEASVSELETVDFSPFKALSHMPWAMTAHIVYTALDATLPASTSKTVIQSTIRGYMGFDGFLVSDDISMDALSGTIDERAANCLEAGSDAILHCNGDRPEMVLVAKAVTTMTEDAMRRFNVGRSRLLTPATLAALDKAEFEARLSAFLAT